MPALSFQECSIWHSSWLRHWCGKTAPLQIAVCLQWVIRIIIWLVLFIFVIAAPTSNTHSHTLTHTSSSWARSTHKNISGLIYSSATLPLLCPRPVCFCLLAPPCKLARQPDQTRTFWLFQLFWSCFVYLFVLSVRFCHGQRFVMGIWRASWVCSSSCRATSSSSSISSSTCSLWWSCSSRSRTRPPGRRPQAPTRHKTCSPGKTSPTQPCLFVRT